MAENSGGGSATNSGIDFQQRIAAFFTLSMALDLDCRRVLDRDNLTNITKVSFETADSIDDIVLTHETAKSYLQVKRKLSLSESKQSDFYKTITQFVKQNQTSQNPNDCFCIVTSSDTSRKILNELKKITKSTRLNFSDSTSNPLSGSEQEVKETLYKCINMACSENKIPELTPLEKQKLIKKIYIIELSIENGGMYENSFLTSIASKFSSAPELIWGMIIAKTLTWSKHRQSVDLPGIKSLLDQFIHDLPNQLKQEQKTESNFNFKFDPDKYNICSGYEVILINTPHSYTELTLISLPRFDENGLQYLKFNESTVKLADNSIHKLHGRFATFTGAERFLLDREWNESKKLTIVESENLHNYNNDRIAVAHSEKVRKKMLDNSDPSKCMHCGKGLSHNALNIEISEEHLPFDVGIIHKECQRASDRVLGVSLNPGIEKYPELKNFDYKVWFSALTRGQALWSGYPNVSEPIKNVLWNSDAASSTGSQCIKVTLADESVKFILQRGKVHRFTSENADLACKKLNKWIVDAKLKNDPLCYSENGEVFSTKNQILESLPGAVEVIECIKFERSTYTRGISSIYDTCENYYTPLITLTTLDDKQILFNDTIFFITNPLTLGKFLANWGSIDLTPPSYNIKIIETDMQFDDTMMTAIDNNQHALVDPVFSKNSELLKGTIIQDFDLWKLENAKFVLHTLTNDDNTHTHILKNQKSEAAFLLSSTCNRENCSCLGCQLVKSITELHGITNITIFQTGPLSSVVVIEENAMNINEELLKNLAIDWEP